MFADHFVVSLIVDHLNNATSRALLCVCKAATTIKQQSPILYNKMRTQKASWVLRPGFRGEIYADFADDGEDLDCIYLARAATLSRATRRRLWPVPIDLQLPVVLQSPLFCSAFPLILPSEKIPKLSLIEIRRVYRENRPCKISWYLDHENTGSTEACADCAKFRSALLGLEPETCHVAKKMKKE